MTRTDSHRIGAGTAARPRLPQLPLARAPLARAIATTLVIKLCVVVAMRVFLFDGAHRPVIDESAMDRRLTVSAPPR
ncbi:hypothetical protein [Azospirillum brasilense]|uniref:hypothetical protein n=1 Tax=Azospirillum brasilense TaxID=192 RepID=UPI000E0CB152|nr:hypothetical protein [Azospirillum brasilense]